VVVDAGVDLQKGGHGNLLGLGWMSVGSNVILINQIKKQNI
jgi:hypothetical protein